MHKIEANFIPDDQGGRILFNDIEWRPSDHDNEFYHKAIRRAGFQVSPCLICGFPVISREEFVAACQGCMAKPKND